MSIEVKGFPCEARTRNTCQMLGGGNKQMLTAAQEVTEHVTDPVTCCTEPDV